MAIKKATENDLRTLIFEHEMVVVMYLIPDLPVSKSLAPFYLKLSKEPLFKNIVFLKINAAESPVAIKIVGETGDPFVIIYKKGFLLRCDQVKTEKKLLKLLKELKHATNPNL